MKRAYLTLATGLALTLLASLASSHNVARADEATTSEPAKEEVLEPTKFHVFTRGCSRSDWQYQGSHDNLRSAEIAVENVKNKVNVQIVTGKVTKHPGWAFKAVGFDIYVVVCRGGWRLHDKYRTADGAADAVKELAEDFLTRVLVVVRC